MKITKRQIRRIIRESLISEQVMWHSTAPENVENILSKGLQPGRESAQTLGGAWADEYYGTRPIYLSVEKGKYEGSPLAVNTAKLNLVADLPSLVDTGAYQEEEGMYWDEGSEPQQMLDIVDEDGMVYFDDLLSPGSAAAQAAIEITGTAASIDSVSPKSIQVVREAKMKITRNQLRRIIQEAMAPNIPDIMGAMGGGRFQPRKEPLLEPWEVNTKAVRMKLPAAAKDLIEKTYEKNRDNPDLNNGDKRVKIVNVVELLEKMGDALDLNPYIPEHRKSIRSALDVFFNMESNLKEQMDHYEGRHQEDQLGLEDHQADVVLEIIQDDEGLPGSEVVARALRNSAFGGLQASDVYKALDILVADGDVFLDTEEDAWYSSNNQEAQEIMMHRADLKAAEEILATRAGSYRGTTLPGGKKIT